MRAEARMDERERERARAMGREIEMSALAAFTCTVPLYVSHVLLLE